jgi:hypothetical protein
MPRSCTVCNHPNRDAIDEALVAGEPSRQLAARYGSLSRPAIQRHGENHLPARLVMAHAAEEVAQADTLLEQVRDLQQQALAILDKAEEAGELRTALSAIREARGNLELLAKLLGELDERPVVNLNLSPEWLELRTAIVLALEPHPDALSDVLRALESTPNGSSLGTI